MSEDTVNHSQVGNVFILGAGGVFVVALSAWAGCLPVLFYFLVLAAATAAWCAAAIHGGAKFEWLLQHSRSGRWIDVHF